MHVNNIHVWNHQWKAMQGNNTVNEPVCVQHQLAGRERTETGTELQQKQPQQLVF